MEAPPPARFPAAEMPPDSNQRSVAVSLCLLHGANVVGCGPSLRNRTTRRILREIVKLYLLVRDADTLVGCALCASAHAVTRDIAICHQDFQIDVRGGGTCRFAQAEGGLRNVLAGVQGFQNLIACLVHRAGEAEVR